MTDQNLDAPVLSTVIDTEAEGIKSGGGKVAPEPAPDKPERHKPETSRDAIEAEFKKISAKGDTDEDDDGDGDDDKAKPDKAEAKTDIKAKDTKTVQNPKPAKAEGEAAPEAEKVSKPSEGRKIIEAPARFLPRAKELWNNVPHPVREEFERVMKESETETARYREAHTFREELKEYDEMAKSHGTTVKQSLENYVAIERKFSEDPAQGFRQLMGNLQMSPPQAISHILRAYGVSPQQLMSHMSQNPDEYTSLGQQRQQPQAAPAQQQRQPDPEVTALKQEMQELRAERVANEVITPFAKEYPEYYENQEQIAKVLKSGIIDEIHGTGLSPRDKLEAALLMVLPSARRSAQAETVQGSDAGEDAPAVDLRGGRSVKSSPGTVTSVTEADKRLPVRDMLEEELRKLQRRA